MQRQLIGQHLLNGGNDHRVVVPQRKGPGTRQAVDKTAAFDVFDIQTPGPLQGQWNASRVTAGIGLLTALSGQQR